MVPLAMSSRPASDTTRCSEPEAMAASDREALATRCMSPTRSVGESRAGYRVNRKTILGRFAFGSVRSRFGASSHQRLTDLSASMTNTVATSAVAQYSAMAATNSAAVG